MPPFNSASPLPGAPATDPATGDDVAGAWLSAATDGDPQALEKLCAAWRDDAQARSRWHTYHLIGDVLRSDDLAVAPARDEAFLRRLRQTMADEPVVLAPARKPAARRLSSAWMVPATVAAGFVVVAGVLVVSRTELATQQPAVPMAALSSPDLAARQVGTAIPAPMATPVAAGSQDMRGLLRDARVDEFLRAHQAARGGLALVVPVQGLRRVEVELPTGTSR
jgi:sigma-E factor negative regulatory protein RseA